MNRVRIARGLALLFSLAALSACDRQPDDLWLGTLEWDRVSLLAEASEPVRDILVREGDTVVAGQALLVLDGRRAEAELAAAQAEKQRLSAQLDELRQGARSEVIDAYRARLSQAQSEAEEAGRQHRRARDLRQQKVIAQAELDRAETARRSAEAATEQARAQLVELLHGTRPETLAQAEAALAAAEARLQQQQLQRERLTPQAPVAGRVDSLPYRLGDQPPAGAAVAVLLSGEAPYARVFIPASQRAGVNVGDRFRVQVEGVDEPMEAVLRSIASEPAFTPYYALLGDDASRLSYRAELVLQGEAARQLPAGLPCRVERIAHD